MNQIPRQHQSEDHAQESGGQADMGVDCREAASGYCEWKADHSAHQQHSADRSQSEQTDIHHTQQDGWYGRKSCQSDRRASGHAMHHSDNKRFTAQSKESVSMLVILLAVNVKVAMGQFAVVAMCVRVQLQSSLPSQCLQDVETEDDQHGSDSHLQPKADLLWYRDLEQQYGHSNRQKRGGVAEAPECADQR